MVGTIKQGYLNVDHWVASKNTILQLLKATFVYCRHVFTWHNTTNDFVNELIAFFTVFTLVGERFNFKPYVTVLTTTTGLTHKLTFLLNTLTNSFAIGNLWLTNVSFHFEFTTHTVNDNI